MLALRMKKAVRNGATLVVADPRKIWLTKIAKRHLQLRPGSDVWLINAMMNVILEEAVDKEEYIREVPTLPLRRAPPGSLSATRPRRQKRSPASRRRKSERPPASTRRTACGDLLHARHHRARVRRRQHLVALEPRADDGSPRLRVDRPQRLARPEQRSGAERLGRQPHLLPRLPAGRRPRGAEEVLRGLGRGGAGEPGYRLDQIMAACHDNRIQALYLIGENPMQTEPTPTTSKRGSPASTSSSRRTSSSTT